MVSLLLFIPILSTAQLANKPEVKAFIKEMASEKTGYTQDELTLIFNNTEIKPDIIALMTKPAEKKPWYEYRKIFLNEGRIKQGVVFWNKHEKILNKVSKEYGVPPQIIIAILGAETHYGRILGGYRVIDALSTLAFDYPPRSKYFKKELEEFLLLCKEYKFDPLEVYGSYAGAMGFPQFMPSNYRSLSVDYNRKGHADLFTNIDDVVASIARYFKHHGWQPNQPVAFRASAKNANYEKYIKKSVKPNKTIKEWEKLGIKPDAKVNSNTPAALLELENKPKNELWLVLNNFYVITRYNNSPLYAMAVYQLSEAIKEQKNKK